MEVGQGLALGQDQQIDPAVVVEIADREAPAQQGNLPGGAGGIRHVDETTAVLGADQELGAHLERDPGRKSST